MGPSPSASVHLLGIRHHGPGSARSVRRALDELEPSAVLIELPADCEGLLEWVGHDRLVPPVAMLGHGAAGSAFLPFAVFSPEWQAALWARARDVPLHAIDLPLAASRAIERHAGGTDPHDAADPLGALAAAAGDDDAERWWDDVVEHRGDGLPAFDAVAEAMRASLVERPLQLREGPLALTVSIGVAGFDPAAGEDGSELYRAADRAMYRAKGDGRNRVRVDGA